MTMITADKLSNEEYHATDAISSSAVKAVHSKSLAHWKAQRTFKPTIAMAIGTCVHDMVLEDSAGVMRGPADRRGNTWKDAFADAEAAGKLLLTAGDYDLARNVSDSLLFHPVGAKMAGPTTINEASFFSTDEATGLDIKCRPDSYDMDAGVIYDIKTCQDSSIRAVSADIWKYSYALQAAFYLHTLRSAGYKAERFIFAFVEKSAPYAVNVTELTKEYIEWAETQMRNALHDIKTANDTQVWDTGYSTGVNVVDAPRWVQTDDDFNN